MITLTVSAGQIFYFGSCFGVMIAGIFLLVLHELIRLTKAFLSPASGAHRAQHPTPRTPQPATCYCGHHPHPTLREARS